MDEMFTTDGIRNACVRCRWPPTTLADGIGYSRASLRAPGGAVGGSARGKVTCLTMM